MKALSGAGRLARRLAAGSGHDIDGAAGLDHADDRQAFLVDPPVPAMLSRPRPASPDSIPAVEISEGPDDRVREVPPTATIAEFGISDAASPSDALTATTTSAAPAIADADLVTRAESLPGMLDVPSSVTAAADDFFRGLIRREERRP